MKNRRTARAAGPGPAAICTATIALALVAAGSGCLASSPPARAGQAEITMLEIPGGPFYWRNKVPIGVQVKNRSRYHDTLWAGLTFFDGAGHAYEVPAKAVSLGPGEESGVVRLIWKVPSDSSLATGSLDARAAIWSERPGKEGAQLLDRVDRPEAVAIFRLRDDFHEDARENWTFTDGALGRGSMRSRNLRTEEGLLRLTLPVGYFDGAQVISHDRYLYGSYQVQLKCPQAPGSICAFFLYEGGSDRSDEIDIEIYNDGSRRADLTTWIKGVPTNRAGPLLPGMARPRTLSPQIELPFDPSTDFHTYRIDFYPGSVTFFADDRLLARFKNDLPASPMLLMANVYWPRWIPSGPPKKSASAQIDWVQF